MATQTLIETTEPTDAATPSARWSALRDDLRTRRAQRTTRRAMERDLDFCSPARLSEMQAILSRYDGPDAELVRDIISRRVA
jgi:hypothetical protein